MVQRYNYTKREDALVRLSYVVDRLHESTARPNGLSRQELDRLDAAVQLMELFCSKGTDLWFLSIESGTSRSRINAIWKRVTKLQRQYGLPQFSVMEFEASRSGELGAHIIMTGTKAIAVRLKRSPELAAKKAVQRVYDAKGLVRGYLAKKRTPQAGWRREASLGGRIKGRHVVEGGGDLIRLSEELKAAAIEAGYVEPWQRTNARRSIQRKSYRLRRLFSQKAPRQAGQLPLLSLRPVARLHDFGGGFIPPAVALEIEFLRRRRGLSQRELGRFGGISQGQYANAIRGHDPISAVAVNRLREILLSAA